MTDKFSMADIVSRNLDKQRHSMVTSDGRHNTINASTKDECHYCGKSSNMKSISMISTPHSTIDPPFTFMNTINSENEQRVVKYRKKIK